MNDEEKIINLIDQFNIFLDDFGKIEKIVYNEIKICYSSTSNKLEKQLCLIEFNEVLKMFVSNQLEQKRRYSCANQTIFAVIKKDNHLVLSILFSKANNKILIDKFTARILSSKLSKIIHLL